MADPRVPNVSAPASVGERETKPSTPTYKLAEVRKDTGEAVIEMEDGRMFPAKVKDGLEGLRKGSTVFITSEGEDADGTPKNATLTRVG